MSSLLQNLCKFSQAMFTNLKLSPTENFEESLSTFMSLFSQVTMKDLYLNPKDLEINRTHKTGSFPINNRAPVSFVSIFENDIFSLTVFGLRRQSSRLPLHDHPGMRGFIKCIQGSVSVKSYTILQNGDLQVPMQIRDKVGHFGSDNIGEEILSSENSGICSLSPFEGNLHEIKPASDQLAVIADILSPPYTNRTNSFFYHIIGIIHDSKLNKSITWLFRTPESNSFFCDTIPYTGPQIKVQ